MPPFTTITQTVDFKGLKRIRHIHYVTNRPKTTFVLGVIRFWYLNEWETIPPIRGLSFMGQIRYDTITAKSILRLGARILQDDKPNRLMEDLGAIRFERNRLRRERAGTADERVRDSRIVSRVRSESLTPRD